MSETNCVFLTTDLWTFRRSDLRTLRTSDLWTFRPSDFRTLRTSDFRTFRLSVVRSFRPSDVQTFRHYDLQTFRPSDTRTFISSDLRMFGPSDVQTFRHLDLQTFRRSDVQTQKQDVVTYVRSPVVSAVWLRHFKNSASALRATLAQTVSAWIWLVLHPNRNHINRPVAPPSAKVLWILQLSLQMIQNRRTI